MGYKLMLKSIRQSRGINQKEMAERLSMPLSTYRTWEQGVSRINLEDACRIAVILDCTPNDLCGWEDDDVHDTPPATDPYESELVGNYRQLTPERKVSLLQSARDGAAMSKSAAKSTATLP